jgi:hypothetical protein
MHMSKKRLPTTWVFDDLHPELFKLAAELEAADSRTTDKSGRIRELLLLGLQVERGEAQREGRLWADGDIDAFINALQSRGLVVSGDAGETVEREEAVDLSEMVLDDDTLDDFL